MSARSLKAYWHRPFAAERMGGEWLKFTGVDVHAFNRWRRVY